MRQCCVSHSQFLLQHHPELFKDIVEQLKVRQHDPEETVRMEVVNVILTVAKNDFSVCTEELLGFIKERTLDKKVNLDIHVLVQYIILFCKENFLKVTLFIYKSLFFCVQVSNQASSPSWSWTVVQEICINRRI